MADQRPEQIAAEGQAIAAHLGNGVRYDGPFMKGRQLFGHSFTDITITGTTFVCHDLEDCKQRLIEKRREFGAKPPEFSSETVRYNNTAIIATIPNCRPGEVPRPQYGKEYNQEGQLVDVCIDAGIVNLIDRLNHSGYKTFQSCSGLEKDHPAGELIEESGPTGPGPASGYISFLKKDLTKEQVKKIQNVGQSAGLWIDDDRRRIGVYTPPNLEAIKAHLPQETASYADFAVPDGEISRMWNSFERELLGSIQATPTAMPQTKTYGEIIREIITKYSDLPKPYIDDMYFSNDRHHQMNRLRYAIVIARKNHLPELKLLENFARKHYPLLLEQMKMDAEEPEEEEGAEEMDNEAMTLEPEVLSQYPIGDVPRYTEKETKVPESPMPILKGTEAPPKVYPRVMSMESFLKEWQPQGWKLIFIGPTATWRQEWGAWEAIRDIVQNALDETETYQFGKDAEGLWIGDQGRGVAVADFLLGPPKLKPNYARGKFGEGMKIASLALLREGYPVHVQTVGKELFMIFIEQEAGGVTVQSLAALWRPDGTRTGTRFHIIGYFGDDYADRFTANLPPGVVVSQAPTNITQPKRRYNQIIRRKFGELSRVFARDIYMRELDSPFSYNLWGFDLSPDRFGPKNDSDMFVDIGRTWAWCNDQALLETFLKMVRDPPDITCVEANYIDMTWSMGGVDIDGKNTSYVTKIAENATTWQAAWDKAFGYGNVLRTDAALDAVVRHLGYDSVSVAWGARDALASAIKTDQRLLAESQDRLREVEIIPDETLGAKELAHLKLARAIVAKVARTVTGVHAAIIPPASDRVRTAGMYGKTTKEIYIAAEQLENARKTVDTTIHEAAHHTSGAEDGQEAHMNDMTRLAGLVVGQTAQGNYDTEIKAPGFTWY